MATIVVLEDDAATRLLITSVLKKSGHAVTALDNGAEGLLVVLAEQPDLVISDVQMPKMTGFEVVAQMRQTAEVFDTPVILLTSLTGRADMRTGMAQGADDYITKPFEAAELIESVNAQLARAQQRQSTLDERAQALAHGSIAQLKQAYEQKLLQASKAANALALGQDTLQNNTQNNTPELPSHHIQHAWVMQVTVQNQGEITSKLSVRDWRLLLRSLYSPSGDASALKTASYVDLSGSDLLLVFSDKVGQTEAASLRAAQAVDDMVKASQHCKRWAASHFQSANLPPLRVAISLHAGPVDMATVSLDSGGHREVALGMTVDQTQSLRSSNPSLLWTAAATDEALAGAPGLFRTGASQRVSAQGKGLHVHALMGLGPAAGSLASPDTEGASWI